MGLWLDTGGKSALTIAVCDRCKFKRAWADLRPDPNFEGLMVCRTVADGCLDEYDPYRLPARQVENITVRSPRPDANIGLLPNGNPISP